jgi:hypothetical protein
MRRKSRKKTAGLEIPRPKEALFLLSFFPELCLLKGTLPKKT